MNSRTPRSRIKGMLRQIFLRSRERARVLKETDYCCDKCGVKQTSKKGEEIKLDVHHVKGIDCWNEIIDIIEDKLLCIGHEEDLQPLCKECHNKETYYK
jgi:predicted HNH restriction endonuclease